MSTKYMMKKSNTEYVDQSFSYLCHHRITFFCGLQSQFVLTNPVYLFGKDEKSTLYIHLLRRI